MEPLKPSSKTLSEFPLPDYFLPSIIETSSEEIKEHLDDYHIYKKVEFLLREPHPITKHFLLESQENYIFKVTMIYEQDEL